MRFNNEEKLVRGLIFASVILFFAFLGVSGLRLVTQTKWPSNLRSSHTTEALSLARKGFHGGEDY